MRHVLALLGFAACAPTDEVAPIEHRSTMGNSTRGLVLHDDGERGHAGMFETNCPFETRQGRVTGDYQLPDEGEEVQDGGTSALGPETVLLTLNSAVHVLEKSTGDYLHQRFIWEGVRDVRLTETGLVGLHESDGACVVEWRVDGEPAGQVALDSCDRTGFDAGLDGTVFLGGDSILVVTPEGTIESDEQGRLIAYDDVLGYAYVARQGDDEVIAIRTDGTRAWSTVLEGAVRGLAAAGAEGAAVVSIELADGSGAIVWLDGLTGDVMADVVTPSAADHVTVSGDGSTIALTLEQEAHFYDVDLSR